MSSLVSDAAPTVLRDLAGQVERAIADHLSSIDLPENLVAAVRYGVLGGGKRLRPVLTLLACEAAGGRREDAMSAAIAIELIHCFSLVHDDLPAMDDDDLRRGRPTLHIEAGEAMAILAGDVMVSLALECLAEAPQLGDSRRTRLVTELSQATTRMIAGQVYDTLGGFPEGITDRQRLELIHRNKTAALLGAACRMGAISAGAGPEKLDRLSRYGQLIGIMFQVVDDLLDVTQSTEHIGKMTGKDESAGKLTYPGLLGIEASRAEVRRLEEEANDALTGLGDEAEPLRALCRYLAVRTR